MKEFLLKIACFFILIMGVLVFSLFFIPDLVARQSLLGAVPDKHAMANKLQNGKIVFIGGSNVSFGLDSKKISEAFKLPVVNMAVHAGLGLKYIADEAKPFIQKGDLVVLIPEYENFYSDNFYGEMELVQVVFEIDKQGRQYINAEQWKHLYKYVPTYSAKKLKNYVSSFFQRTASATAVNIFDRRSFNEYGDAYIHWSLPDQGYMPCKKCESTEQINNVAVTFLTDFQKYVTQRGARLVILPPVIDENSYENQKGMISSISEQLVKNDIRFLVGSKRYQLPASCFFNSYYHPNKKGVDIRTRYVIEDLRSYFKQPAVNE